MPRDLDNSERLFQSKVIQIAKMNGWLVFHPRRSQTSDGRWLTAVQGDVGFPDLVMAHRERGLIYAELKAPGGRVQAMQKTWLNVLDCAGAETYIWYPKDLQAIADRLGGASKRN